ncbi:MAG: DUF6531 domain-containing protein, partial [Proteobacteria bacterium]|nr:DUF6531 domain-containing protein [Pseudomonadota bacterium]
MTAAPRSLHIPLLLASLVGLLALFSAAPDLAGATDVGSSFFRPFSGGQDSGTPAEGCSAENKDSTCGCDPDVQCCTKGQGTSNTDGPNANQQTGTQGDPVWVATGRQFLRRTDLVVNGVFPIEVVRRYDSQSRYDSPLGYGWAFTFDQRLFEYPNGNLVLRRACGERTVFLDAGGAHQPPPERAEVVTQTATGYTIRERGGRKAEFDFAGNLTALVTPQGNRLEFTYSPTHVPLIGSSPFSVDPGRPLTVSRAPQLEQIAEKLADGTVTGRSVTFAYSPTTGRLTSVTASDGRVVHYEHDTVDVDGQTLTQGNLVRVVGLEAIEEAYAYEDPHDVHNVTSIQHGQGTTPVVNTYDDQDRVIRQEFGENVTVGPTTTFDGQVLTFDYALETDPGTPVEFITTVTRRIIDGVDAQANPINERFATTVYEFDANHRYVTIVDALGNRWEYDRTGGFITQLRIHHNQGTVAAPTLVLQKTIDYGYNTDGDLTSSAVTLSGTGETVTQSWTWDQGWLASQQVVSSADPTKVFRTEFTFDREDDLDPTSAPINIRERRRRKDDGTFAVTSFAYDANRQLETITPPAVVPDDGLQIVRTYYDGSEPGQESSVGLLKGTHLEVGGTKDEHLERAFTYDAR